MKYIRYPKYKDSGVAWLGKVPEHWVVGQLRRVTRFEYGDSLAADDRKEGVVAVYGSNGAVGTHSVANTRGPCIVVGRKGSFGKLNYSEEPVFAIDTTYYIDERQSESDLRWLYYAMQPLGLDESSKDSAVPGLGREEAYIQLVAIPIIEEQASIASYLDRETTRIDALIEKKQRLIELLKEKRQAVITQAVTKGLDPNVPMKDSGVEWLGEVPEHWKACPLKWSTSVIETGPFGSQLHASDYIDGGVPLINPAHIINGYIQPDTACTVDGAKAAQLERHKMLEGDIVIARRGEMGRCAVINEGQEGVLCGTGSIKIRTDRKLHYPWYTAEVIRLKGVVDTLSLASVGSTMENLNATIIGDLRLPLPPFSEQESIIKTVRSQLQRLDKVNQKTIRTIKLLQEHRSALITAAVTGQIDVRNHA
jgi:type I restriction enzyme S subunit